MANASERQLSGLWDKYCELRRTNNPLGASQVLAEISTLGIDEGRLWGERGSLAYLGGDFKAAEEQLSKAIDMNPEDVWALHYRGLTRYRESRLSAAIKDLTLAVEQAPHIQILHHTLGEALSDAGDHEGAVAAFSKAIECSPEVAFSYDSRGQLLLKLGRYQEAEEDFSRSIQLDQECTVTRVLRADARLEQRNYQGAIEDLSYVTTEDRPHAYALYLLSMAQEGTGDYRGAVHAIGRAIELDPTNDRYRICRIGLVNSYSLDADILGDAEFLLERTPYGTSWLDVGNGFLKYQRTSEALKAAERGLDSSCLERDEKHSLQNLKYRAHLVAEDFDAARELLEEMKKDNPLRVRTFRSRLRATALMKASRQKAKRLAHKSFLPSPRSRKKLDLEGVKTALSTSSLPESVTSFVLQNLTYSLTVSPTNKESLSFFGGLPLVNEAFVWPEWDASPVLRKEIERYERGEIYANYPDKRNKEIAALTQRISYSPLPLTFLCQIDLSQVAEVAPDCPLPKRGLLYFFWDLATHPPTFEPLSAGAVRVIYSSDVPEMLSEAFPPQKLALYEADFDVFEVFFPKRCVSFTPHLFAPTALDASSVLGNGLSKEEQKSFRDEYNRVVKPIAKVGKSGARHQLLGVAREVQKDPRWGAWSNANGIYSGGGSVDDKGPLGEGSHQDWVLLLQLGSDREDDGFDWGEGGCIYFLIHKEDLAATDFSRVQVIFQCY